MKPEANDPVPREPIGQHWANVFAENKAAEERLTQEIGKLGAQKSQAIHKYEEAARELAKIVTPTSGHRLFRVSDLNVLVRHANNVADVTLLRHE